MGINSVAKNTCDRVEAETYSQSNQMGVLGIKPGYVGKIEICKLCAQDWLGIAFRVTTLLVRLTRMALAGLTTPEKANHKAAFAAGRRLQQTCFS